MSRQKFLYLPEPQNDFIFAIICEELGWFGAALVLILFGILIWKGYRIAQEAPTCSARFWPQVLRALSRFR